MRILELWLFIAGMVRGWGLLVQNIEEDSIMLTKECQRDRVE